MRVYALVGATTAKIKVGVGGEWMQYWTNVNIDTNADARMWGAVATVVYHF